MRNYNDPLYANWRRQIRKRDGYTCRMPGCGAKRKLHTHHIKRWANFPQLRYEVSNGITLCKTCHRIVTGQEEQYEALFMSLTSLYASMGDSYLKIQRIMDNAKRRE